MYFILILYLLVKSHFLGLLNTRFILIGDLPLLNIADFALLIIVVIKWKLLLRILKDLRILKVVFGLAVFFLFFLLYSMVEYTTTMQDALTNFSDFWTFFFFLFLFIGKIKKSTLENTLSFFCLIIGILFLLHKTMYFSFGTYQIDPDAPGRIPLVFNAVFPLFFAIKSHKYVVNKGYKILIFLTLFIGTILWESEFRSLFFSIPLILTINLFLNSNFSINSKKFILLLFLLGSIFFVALGVEAFLQDDAVISRININTARINLFQERPFFGYGFIGKESQVGKELLWDSITRFNSTIKVIDGGYLDLVLRFGIIGMGIYLYLLLKMADFKINPLQFTKYDLYIMNLLIVCLTLSVLSFEVGLLPFFIAAYLNLYRETEVII